MITGPQCGAARILVEITVGRLASRSGGAGVRLKFTRSDSKQISRMENEGGMPASNVVP
ncbi:hypothetical protein [Pusillimonas sp.]|uniref:hypothetical protein n=1 Tax=Pusillimonas sp. TaxID=3040095 RepID=UPI0037C63B76